MGRAVALAALAFATGRVFAAADQPKSAISDVSVSRPFFNPSLDQRVSVSFDLAQPGNLTVQILDRDGYSVRKLVSDRAIERGKQTLDWDGRDDGGEVVPDEAYSLKIDLASEGKLESYFPALAPMEDVTAKTNYYDRNGATLSYQLPRASRVHLQAGIAKVGGATKKPEGPVLRTLVNREPRPAGAVVESWNGFDEGGTFYVPDLSDFVVAIAATSLPENAILATGNRARIFLERAADRTGVSLLPKPRPQHAHHRGLNALEDVAPTLKAKPLDASWSAAERIWRPTGKNVKVSVDLQGPSAKVFERQPAELYVFVDRSKVLTVTAPHAGDTLSIPVGKLSPGSHIVAINWASSYGPVAVDSWLLKIGGRETPRNALRQ